MPYIRVGQENSGSIDLHYEDHGSGPPVVLIHGYPLSGRAWDKQVPVLLDDGCRVITYDRRGFGKSSQPATGYDYDTFCADLRTLMEALDLRDATLVGHSMGTGEVTRYVGRYGSERVARGVLISPIPPFLLQTADNPEGLPASLFDGFMQAARQDTPAWMKGFLDNFYNFDKFRGSLVSDQACQASFNISRRSRFRCWSSRETMTGSCPTRTPASGCVEWSETCRWSSSMTDRTPSPGPITTRSIAPC